RDVDPQETVGEAAELRRLEVLDGLLEVAGGEVLAAPDLPGEVVALAAGGVEHQPVEREALHLLDVLPHELRVRLVPAPLNDFLALDGVLLRAGSGRRRDSQQDGQRTEQK